MIGNIHRSMPSAQLYMHPNFACDSIDFRISKNASCHALHINIASLPTLARIFFNLGSKIYGTIESERKYKLCIQPGASQRPIHHRYLPHSASQLEDWHTVRSAGMLLQSQMMIIVSCLHTEECTKALHHQEAWTSQIHEVRDPTQVEGCNRRTWICHKASAVHGSSIHRSKCSPLCLNTFCASH